MSIVYPLTLPTSPKFRSQRFRPDSAVALGESPYTFVADAQAHGGKRLLIDCVLPPMTRAEAEAYNGTLLALNGREGTFLLGDNLNTTPRGVGTGTPIVRYRRNAYTYSEQFDNAIWTKFNSTITANSAVNPVDGATTADSLVAATLNTPPGIHQEFATQSGVHAHSAFVKAGTKTWARYRWNLKDGSVVNAWYNLGTGALGTVSGGVTAAIYRHTSWPAGWYRCSAETDILVGGGMGQAVMSMVDGDAIGTCTISVGDVAAYIFGAQDEIASSPGSYVQTVAAAVAETPVAGAQVLYTDGWTASQTGILKLGDWWQLGTGLTSRLHKLVYADADSDAWGNAALDIWPGLREVPADAAPLVVTSPKGLFRLADNRQAGWSLDHLRFYGLGFTAMEAL